ncbi:MAG: FG-GAP repeat domain-containing protein [Gemmataceae bacterium]
MKSTPVRFRSKIRTSGHELESRVTPTVNASTLIAIGSGPGMDATVRVLDVNGNVLDTFTAFPLQDGTQFQGGVETAVGDINGDNIPDIICGAGPGGGPHVKVFNGADVLLGSPTPTVIRSFFAYESWFRGGVNVAAGDVNGDGLIDIVTGAGPGASPHVVAYSNGNDAEQLMNFFPYDPSFRGGVHVACGDLGGDGIDDEVVCGAGEGGGPKIVLFNRVNATTPTLASQRLAEFFAFDPAQRGGVYVAAGYTSNNRDQANNRYEDIIAGTGPGVTAEVRVFRLLDALKDELGNPNWQYSQAATVNPYGDFAGGVRVGVVRNGIGDDFTTGAGPGGGPHFKIFNQTSVNDLETYVPTQRFEAFEFDPSFLGGIYVS